MCCGATCRVQVTVIDANGRRYPVRGLEGQSLVEILLADEGPLDVSNRERAAIVSHVACCSSLGDELALAASLPFVAGHQETYRSDRAR